MPDHSYTVKRQRALDSPYVGRPKVFVSVETLHDFLDDPARQGIYRVFVDKCRKPYCTIIRFRQAKT